MSGKKLNNILNAAANYREEGLVKINDQRILIKVMDPSESAQFACQIPKDAMYEFDTQGINEIAVDYKYLADFIPNSDEGVELEYSQYNKINKISVRYGNSEVRVSTITKNDVPDIHVESPSIEAVKILNEPDFLHEFINKCETIGTDYFMISPRDGIFYLYAEKNDNEVIERIMWEDFNNYDINWDKATIPDESDINNPSDPSETHEIDVMLSCDLVKDMVYWTDSVMFYFDNHMPMKSVFEDDDGIKVSWMLAPRIPRDGEPLQLPDNVMNQRGLQEMTASNN